MAKHTSPQFRREVQAGSHRTETGSKAVGMSTSKLLVDVHSSIIHKSQKVDTMQAPIN